MKRSTHRNSKVRPPITLPYGGDLAARFVVAIDNYDANLEFYNKQKVLSRVRYEAFQGAAVVLGGLTPVLILMGGVAGWVQATPAALGSICAGIVAFAQWRENWVRFGEAAEALKAERAMLDTRTGKYPSSSSDEQILDAFMAAVVGIVTEETSSWRGIRSQGGEQQPPEPS